MADISGRGTRPAALVLADLAPYVSVLLLACDADDTQAAFGALRRFLSRSAGERGRGISARVTGEIELGADDVIAEIGPMRELGIANLYGLTRILSRRPSWADPESGLVDSINQLTVAVGRGRLVAVASEITSDAEFRNWVNRQAAPYRFIAQDVLAATFPGDGRRVWTKGVHRRRPTKADSKALGGLRLQEALHPLEDGSYALTAATVDFQPADEHAVLRDSVTYSGKSRVSWKRSSGFPEFLAAIVETLDLLEKSLVASARPVLPFGQLAHAETDLTRVSGAFDISVANPDEVRADPDATDEDVDRAELLREVLLEVRGKPDSPTAVVDVGRDGSVAGALALTPVAGRGGVTLTVRPAGPASAESIVRDVRNAIGDGDLLTVYYESGHAFTGGQLSRQNLSSRPFPNLEFADFTGYKITKEKPNHNGDQAIHDAIARNRDNSLFAWVVKRFGRDWLLCDDGAGEVADFLHLSEADNTLTAIHVKAADNASVHRRIAVTRFEQVVSQAEKNARMLDNATLIDRLRTPRIARPAAWHAGRRVPAADFVARLGDRVAADRTNVIILQPHLLAAVCTRARAAVEAGQPTAESYSLMLLDTLLHSTRRTISGMWDDLTVIGAA